MIDCLISFITFIVVSIKSLVYHFLFRPPKPPSTHYYITIVYKVTEGNENEPEVIKL
jgi:hypothetical protein